MARGNQIELATLASKHQYEQARRHNTQLPEHGWPCQTNNNYTLGRSACLHMGGNPCAPSIQAQLTDHLLLQISYACDLAQSISQQHVMLWVLPADKCRTRAQAPTIKPPNPKPPCKLMKPSLRLLSCNGGIKFECGTSASLCKLSSPDIASPGTTGQPNVKYQRALHGPPLLLGLRLFPTTARI